MTVTIESKGKNYAYPEFCTALHAHKIDWDIIVVKIETLIVFSVQEFERLINLENLQQNKKGYNEAGNHSQATSGRNVLGL